MTWLYRLLIRTCVPLAFVYLWLRGAKAPAYRRRWRERLALQAIPIQARHGLLIHCVSVGETVAARQLIERLLQQYPSLPVTLSSMTPTASELARSLFGERVHHLYLPLDTPAAMQRFFNKLAPRAVVILETELWPSLLQQATRRDVPVILLNARMSEKSERTYHKYGWLLGPIWQQLTWVGAQNESSYERFRGLGVGTERIGVRGNLKFDSQAPAELLAEAATLKHQLQRPIVVAASTHNGEDEIVLAAYQKLLHSQPDALLILVPRHPERFAEVASKVEATGFALVRRSSGQLPQPKQQVWLGDSMGELLLWYAVADVAFIGGSLITRGGHNPLEPLATNTPIVTGRHVFNFADIFERLERVQAVRWAEDAKELAECWQQLLTDDDLCFQVQRAATEEFAQDQGATAAMLTDIDQLLVNDEQRPNGTELKSAMELNSMKNIATYSPHKAAEVWYDRRVFDSFENDFFSAEYWRQKGKIKGSATGRSTAWFIDNGEQGMLLRHYYRGGLVGKVNKDRFAREVVSNSRAMAEFELLLQLRERDLPVPKPLAARFERARIWGYRADILVETIPHTQDVFRLLGQRSLTSEEWFSIGAVIRQFHQQGVYHSDLNCHNVMLDKLGKVWLVDFDKCELRPTGEWQQDNLARLLRSLVKETTKAKEASREFHWQEQRDWPQLIAGYDKANKL